MGKEHLLHLLVMPSDLQWLNQLVTRKLKCVQAQSGSSFRSLFMFEPPSHPLVESYHPMLGSIMSNI
jgi:hypothetical protein